MKSCKIQRPGDEQEVRQVCSDGLETNALIIQLFRRIPIWIRAGYLVREVLRAETCRLHPLGVPAGEQYGTEDLHVLHQIKLLLPLTVYTPLPNTLQTPHTCACSQSSALSRISPIPSFLPSFLSNSGTGATRLPTGEISGARAQSGHGPGSRSAPKGSQVMEQTRACACSSSPRVTQASVSYNFLFFHLLPTSRKGKFSSSRSSIH